MKMTLDNNFKKRMGARFSQYEFEVGVLRNVRHRSELPRSRGLKSFMGGPALKTSNKYDRETVAEISSSFQAKDQYLTKPLKKNTAEIQRFKEEAVKLSLGRSKIKRVQDALAMVIVKPILERRYRQNGLRRTLEKGFNRYMIATGQFVRNIKARVKRV